MSLTFFDKKPTISADYVRTQIELINRLTVLLSKASDSSFNSQAQELLVNLGDKLGETIDQPGVTESKRLT